MADPEVVETILRLSGYVDIAFEQTDALVSLGATVEDAMAFQLSLGPAAAIFREGGDLATEKRPVIEAEMRNALATARPARRRLHGDQLLGRHRPARLTRTTTKPRQVHDPPGLRRRRYG